MDINLEKEFHEFLNCKRVLPPQNVTALILQRVNHALNPRIPILLFKLALIQLFIGTLTLLFCPQFDFSLTNNYDLFHFFHRNFGVYGCMVACGTVFMGCGSLFAGLILNFDEIRKIKQFRLLYFSSVSAASLTVFIAMGASIHFDLFAFWLIGAILGGISTFEAGSLINIKKFVQAF